MRIIKMRFTGLCPILMHSERGANPLDKAVVEHKKLTSKRKKTDDDFVAIAWSEYQLGIYHDPELGPYVPATNIDKCIVEGARKNKLGKAFESSARCVADRVRLDYDGPREVRALYEAGFVDMRGVGVSQSRVMRCRPIFPRWSLSFDFAFDESVADESSVIMAADMAGKLVGLGDYRPRFGRFAVEVLK